MAVVLVLVVVAVEVVNFVFVLLSLGAFFALVAADGDAAKSVLFLAVPTTLGLLGLGSVVVAGCVFHVFHSRVESGVGRGLGGLACPAPGPAREGNDVLGFEVEAEENPEAELCDGDGSEDEIFAGDPGRFAVFVLGGFT